MIPYKQTLGDGGEEQLFFLRSQMRALISCIWFRGWEESQGGKQEYWVTIKNKQDKMWLRERER